MKILGFDTNYRRIYIRIMKIDWIRVTVIVIVSRLAIVVLYNFVCDG